LWLFVELVLLVIVYLRNSECYLVFHALWPLWVLSIVGTWSLSESHFERR